MGAIRMQCARCGKRAIHEQDGPLTLKGGMPKMICEPCEKVLREFNNPSRKEYSLVGKLEFTG